MEREGTAVTCDGRLFHKRAAATGNALSPTVDRRCIYGDANRLLPSEPLKRKLCHLYL